MNYTTFMIQVYIERYYNQLCKWCRLYEKFIILVIFFCILIYVYIILYMEYDIRELKEIEQKIDMNATFIDFSISKFITYQLLYISSQFYRTLLPFV